MLKSSDLCFLPADDVLREYTFPSDLQEDLTDDRFIHFEEFHFLYHRLHILSATLVSCVMVLRVSPKFTSS